MHFTMISACGEGANLLHDIELEGNEVELYIKDQEYKRVWDGLIKKVDKIKPPEDSVVIFDFSGMGKVADSLRAAGYPTIGGSAFADKLEEDRMFGIEFAEKAGILAPLTAHFDNFSVGEVEDFIGQYEEDKRWFFKPSGKMLPCFLTYCGHDKHDLLTWVSYVEKNYGRNVESFVLQEMIEGTVVSSEAWCNGVQFVKPFNHTCEVKKFMDGELGQATGCSGNAVVAEHDPMCRIVSEGIARIERAVVDSGYVGPIDLNAVVNEKGVYFLEWTPRMGYSGMPSLSKMLRGNLGKTFSDIARGQGSTMPLVDGYASAVKLSIPPHPLELKPGRAKDSQLVSPNIGIPIQGVPEGKESSFYWYEVEDQDDQLVHSVGCGVIADVIGLGSTVEESFKEPYEILDAMLVPNKQYRTDLVKYIGEAFEQMNQLEKSTVGTGASA